MDSPNPKFPSPKFPAGQRRSAERSGLDERRSTYRTPLVCPVAYQILQDGIPTGTLRSAGTVNLSSKGVLIRTNEPMALGGRYHLQVQLPGTKLLLLATSRVTRVEEEEMACRYLIGFQFEKLEPPEPVEFLARLESLDLRQILEDLLVMKGSDLHLTLGQPPITRIKGHLAPMKRPAFHTHEIRALLYSIMNENQVKLFESSRELDFAFSLSMDKRFRFNLHWQRGQVEAAIRVIPAQIMDWEKLGVPPVVMEWTRKANGLILIIGPTGSGKTTTMSTLVEQINQERDAVIVCLERPIEYLHQNKKAVIKQREVGSDTLSFAEAVKRALRQDPDVIVVGEVEDAETAQVVLNAAETGNLVLASFHATNTVQALDRLMNLCPSQQRNQIAFQLASCLRGVLTQHLLPKEEVMGGGLILATEVFVPTEAGRNHIRNNNLTQLYSVIETGASYNMHPLESSIRQLHTQGIISAEVAESHLALIGQRR